MKYCGLRIEIEYEDFSNGTIFHQFKKEGSINNFPSVLESIDDIRAIVKKEGKKAKRMDFVFAIWHDSSRDFKEIYRHCFWINTDYDHKKEFRMDKSGSVLVTEKEWYIAMGKDFERMIECKKEHDEELLEQDREREIKEAAELTHA